MMSSADISSKVEDFKAVLISPGQESDQLGAWSWRNLLRFAVNGPDLIRLAAVAGFGDP